MKAAVREFPVVRLLFSVGGVRSFFASRRIDANPPKVVIGIFCFLAYAIEPRTLSMLFRGNESPEISSGVIKDSMYFPFISRLSKMDLTLILNKLLGGKLGKRLSISSFGIGGRSV